MLSVLKDISKSISLMDIIARNKIRFSFLRWVSIVKSTRKLIQAFYLLKEIII